MNGIRQAGAYLLATDLDGTLIPLDGNQQNRDDLAALMRRLSDTHGSLVFVTGRHLESVCEAIKTVPLPVPKWMICDVGSSVYQQDANGDFQIESDYADHLDTLANGVLASQLASRLTVIDGLREQPAVQQGQYKSSWFCDRDRISIVVEHIEQFLTENDLNYGVISSVDPLTGEGLIDLLPSGVTKAFALQWLIAKQNFSKHDVIFSGDSGNDLAALTAGYRAVLVSNATGTVRAEAVAHHRTHGTVDLFFASDQPATSGVLDGLNHHLQQMR